MIKNSVFLLLICLFINVSLISPGLAYSEADSTNQSYSTDDGPHVFWQDDSTVLVFYLCESTVDSVRYEIRDTLIFSGRCFDTGQNITTPTIGNKLDLASTAPVPVDDIAHYRISEERVDAAFFRKL